MRLKTESQWLRNFGLIENLKDKRYYQIYDSIQKISITLGKTSIECEQKDKDMHTEVNGVLFYYEVGEETGVNVLNQKDISSTISVISVFEEQSESAKQN